MQGNESQTTLNFTNSAPSHSQVESRQSQNQEFREMNTKNSQLLTTEIATHSDVEPTRKLSETQKRLLDLLRTGRKFSKQEILHTLHIWNSGDQIMKLRRAGYAIGMEMVTRNDQTFGVYFLQTHERPGQAEASAQLSYPKVDGPDTI